MPGVVKYSVLARNVTLRGTITGMKNESQNDRWLLARIAGPSSGTFSQPLGPRPPQQAQERADEDELRQPVEQSLSPVPDVRMAMGDCDDRPGT